VSEWGAGTKRRSGACRGGRETRDVGASMEGCGREVREEEGADGWGSRAERELANGWSTLTGEVHREAGENGRGHGRIGANRSAPLGSERVRERRKRVWARASVDRWGPPVKGGGRARGWASLAGLGRNEVFHFSGISNAFYILFCLGFSIQIQINFQIQTKSNMCTNSKNILDSA
jgi:hypothetical protein